MASGIRDQQQLSCLVYLKWFHLNKPGNSGNFIDLRKAFNTIDHDILLQKNGTYECKRNCLTMDNKLHKQ